MSASVTSPRNVIELRTPSMEDPWRWLAAGWHDFWRHPAESCAYGALFVLIGSLATAGLWSLGMESLAPALAAGFVLLGPVFALGLYEMSRRDELREPVSFSSVITTPPPAPAQFAFLSFCLMFLFLVWLRVAMLNYALFSHGEYLPLEAFTQFVLSTEPGLTMLIVGTILGGILAFIAYAISVVSVPILMRHDVDVITAISMSLRLVLDNPGPMLLWAWLVAVLTAIGLATMFLGLIVIFPLIGHATWHAYRTCVAVSA